MVRVRLLSQSRSIGCDEGVGPPAEAIVASEAQADEATRIPAVSATAAPLHFLISPLDRIRPREKSQLVVNLRNGITSHSMLTP